MSGVWSVRERTRRLFMMGSLVGFAQDAAGNGRASEEFFGMGWTVWDRGGFRRRVGLLAVKAEVFVCEVIAVRAWDGVMLPSALCYYHFYTLLLRHQAVITKRTCFTLLCITFTLSLFQPMLVSF